MLSLLVLFAVTACQQGVQPVRAKSLTGLVPGAPGRLGSYYAINVPSAWDGTLFLYSHGTIVAPSGRRVIVTNPQPAIDDGIKHWLLDHGYAIAAAGYGNATGWAVQDCMGRVPRRS